MEEKITKVLSIIIIIITFSFSILFLTSKKTNFSENENRTLATFPSFEIKKLIHGDYIKQLEEYMQDQFPFRDFFLSYKTKFYQVLGQNKINGIYIGKNQFLIEEFPKPQNEDRIIRIINKFTNDLEIPSYFLLAPTSYEIYQEYLPEDVIGANEKEVFKKYQQNLTIPVISVFSTFNQEKDNHLLYYKTDHHWTTYGAYYAYLRYQQSLNRKFHTLSEYKIEKVSDSFLGTLHSKTLTMNQEKDTIYRFSLEKEDYTIHYPNRDTNTFYEESYLTKKDKYSYFLDNNHAIIEIENNQLKKGMHLLIIKDSYANSVIPFLASHYQKITVIDPRYYNGSIKEYIKEQAIDEVLFIYNILTIDTDLGITSIH